MWQGALCFPILSDPDHKIIDAYGLRDPAYEGQKFYGIPHPAVYVIDKPGKVARAKIESNYRDRPANDEIRVALDTLKVIRPFIVSQAHRRLVMPLPPGKRLPTSTG
ncbi:MAG: redoxin domain-containing protein [Pyrinomonadaceae bacterium]